MLKPEDLVAILRTIPEVRLELIDVAWDLTDEDGDFDYDQALVHIDRVERAIGEAQAYARATHQMRSGITTWLLEDSAP